MPTWYARGFGSAVAIGSDSDWRARAALMVVGLLAWVALANAQTISPAAQPAAEPAANAAEPAEPETWGVHGQATNTWQFQPAFRSPYRARRASVPPPTPGRRWT